MGNMCSGRKPSNDAKGLTSRFLSIDIRDWNRQEMLWPGNAFRCSWLDTGAVVGSVKVQVDTDHLVLSELSIQNVEVDPEIWTGA